MTLLPFNISVLGEFLQPNRIIDPVKFVDVTVGRPVEIRCPPYTYTHPANFLWGSIPASGAPVVLHTTGRRYVLSNGNLFYSFMEDSDLTEVNTRLSGVSCILYILGKYRPSVKIQFRKQGGKGCNLFLMDSRFHKKASIKDYIVMFMKHTRFICVESYIELFAVLLSKLETSICF